MTALRLLSGALGMVIILIGFGHIIFGSAIIPGGMTLNATMDSEERFLGAIFAGYGMAWLWCANDLSRRRRAMLFLSAIFCLGGFARLVSMAVVGLPDQFFMAMTAIELGLPLVFLAGLRRLHGHHSSRQVEQRDEP